MKILLLLSLIVVADCQISSISQVPTALLRSILDSLFAKLDNAPKNSVLTPPEWDGILNGDDVDHDTCVTLQEYLVGHAKIPSDALNTNMFHYFDRDSDNCLTISEVNEDFKVMDADGNGQVNLQEFDNHLTDLVTKCLVEIFNQGGTIFG